MAGANFNSLGNLLCDKIDELINEIRGGVEVQPSDEWEGVIQAAVTAALEDVLRDILIEALETADITVNAVQSGTWTVDLGSVPDITLTPETIADLVAAIENGGPYDVNVTNGVLTVTLDQASLEALETITVTVDTSAGPVEVSGTVTIDQSGGPLLAELSPASLEALENITVTVDTTNGPVSVELADNTVQLEPGQLSQLLADDDTDDDLRPVAVQCYCWTGTDGSTGEFMGYGTVNEVGAWQGYQVVQGVPAPAGAIIQCQTTKLLQQMMECPAITTNDTGNNGPVGTPVNVDISDDNTCTGVTSYGAPTNLVNLLPADITGTAPNFVVTPSSVGAWSYDVEVFCDGDSIGNTVVSGTATATPNNPPTVVPGQELPNQNNAVGQPIAPLAVASKFTDSDGTIASYSATGLPPGLSINATTGEITGTPAAGAESNSPYSVVVTATDDDGATVDCPFTWTIQLSTVEIRVEKNLSQPVPGSGIPIIEGSQVVFGVVVFNDGPDDATGIVIDDLLPAGLTYVSSNPTQGTYDENTGEWAVGNVVNGALPAILEITATVNPGTAGQTITNSASLASVDQTDSNGANNSDDAAVVISQTADYEVVKNIQQDGNFLATGDMCDGNLQIEFTLEDQPGGQDASFNANGGTGDGFQDTAVYDPPADVPGTFSIGTGAMAGVGSRRRATVRFTDAAGDPVIVSNVNLYVIDQDKTGMDFAPYLGDITGITKLSGDAELMVAGNKIFNNNPSQAGSPDQTAPINTSTGSGYGLVQVQGSYTEISWDYVVDHDSGEIHHLQFGLDCAATTSVSVDDSTGNNGDVNSPLAVDVSNLNTCPGTTTYGQPTNLVNLVPGSISGAAPNVTVTPDSPGFWAFDVPVLCDGTLIGTTTISGNAFVPAAEAVDNKPQAIYSENFDSFPGSGNNPPGAPGSGAGFWTSAPGAVQFLNFSGNPDALNTVWSTFGPLNNTNRQNWFNVEPISVQEGQTYEFAAQFRTDGANPPQYTVFASFDGGASWTEVIPQFTPSSAGWTAANIRSGQFTVPAGANQVEFRVSNSRTTNNGNDGGINNVSVAMV